MFVDLDAFDKEEIDTVQLNGVKYDIGDVTAEMMQKIWAVDLESDVSIYDQWRPIVKEILEIRNENVNVDDLWRDKIEALIRFLIEKIKKQVDATQKVQDQTS